MTLNEFDIIHRFFEKPTLQRLDTLLGIGDDAAIVTYSPDQELVITTDTLVSGVHFPQNTSAYDIGYKALAVNLSDLAAMGATPAWVTLALTLPQADETWLKDFSEGFFNLANQYQIQLIGGDITKGPLSITIQAHGLVPKGLAIRRDGAKPGDLIYITNTLGDAGLALELLQKKNLPDELMQQFNRPEPQVAIGEKLRGIAHAAIDISDGLVADLQHILNKSSVGAVINVDALPLSAVMLKSVPLANAISFALSSGDDYELCFTVPENKLKMLELTLQNFSYTCIGTITDSLGLNLLSSDGQIYALKNNGYEHF